MLHAGLDLSRRRLDVCLLDEAGELVAQTAAPPDADGLSHLAERLRGQPVRAVIESTTGARFAGSALRKSLRGVYSTGSDTPARPTYSSTGNWSERVSADRDG